jgi:hypothetical protein
MRDINVFLQITHFFPVMGIYSHDKRMILIWGGPDSIHMKGRFCIIEYQK